MSRTICAPARALFIGSVLRIFATLVAFLEAPIIFHCRTLLLSLLPVDDAWRAMGASPHAKWFVGICESTLSS